MNLKRNDATYNTKNKKWVCAVSDTDGDVIQTVAIFYGETREQAQFIAQLSFDWIERVWCNSLTGSDWGRVERSAKKAEAVPE